jgi:hypothetical protein
MNDFRTRFGVQLAAAAARLQGAAPEADFRARFGVALSDALVALERAPQRRRAPADVLRPGDFRARLGAQLTAAAATLGARRGRLGASWRDRRTAHPARAALGRWGLLRSPGDFRSRLGMQLTASAAVLAGPPSPAAERRDARRPHQATMPRLARPLAVAVAVTALAGAAAASSLWLVTVGNPNGGVNPGLSSTPPPDAQLGALAVLRRPQAEADRGPGVQTALEDINDFTAGVRSNYVRELETTAGGPIVLVPVVRRDASHAGGAGAPAAGAIADALCVYYPIPGTGPLGAAPACWSTAQLLAGRAVSSADGHVFGLAPDGVRSVTISLGGAAAAVSAPVLGNFFDAPLPSTNAPVGGAPAPPGNPVVTFHRG